MTLVPFNKYEIDDIEVRQERYPISDELVRFIEGSDECVEIKDYQHHSPESCRSSFARLIMFMGIENITVRMRGGRVFLIKEQ